MIIVGAKGFAKELLEVCYELNLLDNLVFFDNVSEDTPIELYNRFPILRSETEVKEHFKKFDTSFALGVGNPVIRKQLCELFESWGGELTSLISPKAHIGHFGITIGPGATILGGATITNEAQIGRGLLMYPNAIITHDCKLGDFVELSPGAILLGNSEIKNNTHIGSNATILPKVKIGNNTIVAAGSVVIANVIDNCMVAGIPAIIKKKL
jgi:sugar O-acyltransferase (sialic acid O-acetyltransferase NeuD family)